ncbi:unnamed protein product [Cyberlindnera jadinii]|uniref:Uncharacterized protein n=1 Tax=Cyberlindnera jadinii (strain ATCC 18201 / CBS 1600 / BCRC 20928 / JCM 3617 / NBRC 0987 / NRRL Y-1542) TaxID=983966 RepID=A0A0H5C2M7_CYBJN|nr:unnamed protein product [Cyberlindnera jadinii]
MIFINRVSTLVILLNTVFGDSVTFTWKLDASGTAIDGYEPKIGENTRVDLNEDSGSLSGYIDDQGQFIVDGKTMGIGKNYLSAEAQSSSWIVAEPFTIVDGYLKLYGSDFHAVPNGDDDGYVLGSINAAAKRSDMIPVKIKAQGSDGSAVADYDASSTSTTADETTAEETTSATVTASETTAEETTAEETTAEETTAEETTAEETTAEETTAEETTSEETASQTATAEKTTSGEATSGTVTTEETTVETSAEETTADKTTAEETTVETSAEETTTSPTISTYDNGALKTAFSAINVGAILLALL